MPQMMPMLWSLLFMLVMFLFFCSILHVYFMKLFNIKLNKPKMMLPMNFNWEW